MRALLAVLLVLVSTSATAERWFADPQKSLLEFVGMGAHEGFRGTVNDYWVDMNFDPDNLQNASVKITLRMESVDTGSSAPDSVRDQQQQLYATLFPTAQFVSTNITSADGLVFTADGALTMRGVTGKAVFTFTFEKDAQYDFATLVGYARVDRLKFAFGIESLIDTNWVGDPVEVKTNLYMRRTLE